MKFSAVANGAEARDERSERNKTVGYLRDR